MEGASSKEYNLKINNEKFKIMACSKQEVRNVGIELNGKIMEEVKESTCLGSRIIK